MASSAAPRSSSERDAGLDYGRFCAGVKALCGIDLSHYRRQQMERRLRTFSTRQGAADLDAYLVLLTVDPSALDRFRDRMTINVSELFRNPERFVELENDHIPRLAASSKGSLSVWSAGCSYGAEPYTLSILLHEARNVNTFTLRATDIDTTVLERAKEGRFTPQDLRNVDATRVRRWFPHEDDEGSRQASKELCSSIRFGTLDLLKDRYPGSCDLILCRNVVIYFNEDTKKAIYERFFDALRPGGLLFVGSTERINAPREMGWEKAGTFFYQRPSSS